MSLDQGHTIPLGTLNPNFVTELSNKLEHISPRDEGAQSNDLYDENLQEMTASYTEIFDTQTSQTDSLLGLSDDNSLGESPRLSNLNIAATALKKKLSCQESFSGSFSSDGENKRPERLELEKSNSKRLEIDKIHDSLGDLHLEGTVTKEGDMVIFVAEDLETKIKLSSPVMRIGDTPPFPATRSSTPCLYRQALMPQLPQVDPNVLNDLEIEVRKIATSVDSLTENLAGILHSVSALTVDCLETYQDAVCKTCDAVDSNIKSMYQLMAKWEELSKSMKPIYRLSEQIKEIKRLLDLFETAVNT